VTVFCMCVDSKSCRLLLDNIVQAYALGKLEKTLYDDDDDDDDGA